MKTKVLLLGDIDIREQARAAIGGMRSIEIAGELAGFEQRHLRFVEEIAPDVVVVDGAAFDIDAYSTISTLQASGTVDRIVAIAPDSRSRQLLIDSGADVVVSTREELRTAVIPALVEFGMSPDFDRAA